jgi:putative phosphoesterase
MKYAIISDIHGNLPAFTAVLKQLEIENPDYYIFLGDYFSDFPFPNQVIDTMKNLENTCMVGGNKEKYLTDYQIHDESKWVHNQFNAVYWNFKELTKENLDFLLSLPMEKTISLNHSQKLLALHDLNLLIKNASLDKLRSIRFAEALNKGDIIHKDYLKYVQTLLSSDDTFHKQLEEIDADIIVFGHTHLQWHATINGKLLINAGSCGLPLDGDITSAYTILDIEENHITVHERRVAYDIPQLIDAVKASDLFTHANDWCNLIFHEISTAKEEVGFFFRHAYEVADKNGQNTWPLSNQIWSMAIDSWFENKEVLSPYYARIFSKK